VDTGLIERAITDIKELGPEGLIMAAPLVPLEVKEKLLELGKRHGLFCSSSFTAEEIQQAMDSGILTYVDLLAINIIEAAVAAGIQSEKTGTLTIVKSAV